ncbi:hypothetical protein TNCV_2000741 [Trichonephila clavipes]|nr:hypothetical protein TNCV_2000741 [Trichonephila clavipes]
MLGSKRPSVPNTRQTFIWLTFEVVDTILVLVSGCSSNSRNTCSSSSDVLALLVRPVTYIPLTNKTGFSETPIYTRAFGNGPRNFELWSSDEDDT